MVPVFATKDEHKGIQQGISTDMTDPMGNCTPKAKERLALTLLCCIEIEHFINDLTLLSYTYRVSLRRNCAPSPGMRMREKK